MTQCTSQVGRPDDGTDTTGFFNTEYFVDLKPKEEWRPVFHQNKEELIAAMDRELEKIPGVIWNFSQPISDNMEEAVSGVKGELAIKIYGDDLKTLEGQGRPDRRCDARDQRDRRSGPVPRDRPAESELQVDREAAARYQINVADVQDAIQTAVGGNALTQVLQGEQRYDLVMRYLPRLPRYARKRSKTSACFRPPASAFRSRNCAKSRQPTARRRFIAKANQRYVAIKYSVRGRDLGSAVRRSHREGGYAGEAAGRLSHRLGGRI